MKFVRALLRRRHAVGGAIRGPSRPSDDSMLVRLSPGYVSYDGGETWREYPAEPTEEKQ